MASLRGLNRMDEFFHALARGWVRLLFAAVLLGGTTAAVAADANTAGSLRAKFATLTGAAGGSQFKRPLYLDSVESATNLRGDIYALVDAPFPSVNAALNGPAHWCDVMILHINTKYCAVSTNPTGTMLMVNIGKKTEQPLAETSRVEFDYRVMTSSPDYFAVQLAAATGPFSTSDYRIVLEAAPADNGKSIVHLTYSYAYGFAGRVAMQAYLATAGRGKVGFTVTGKESDGAPAYISGVRGVVERNTMRYFLAIDAYLGALAAPNGQQLDRRLNNWFDATEAYPLQLREVDRVAYVEMKRREYVRQQGAQ